MRELFHVTGACQTLVYAIDGDHPTSVSIRSLFLGNLFCHFACNLQKTKSLTKHLPNLKSIKFPILYWQWHANCLATKASRGHTIILPTHIHIHTCAHIHAHTYKYTHTHTHLHTHTDIRTHIHTLTYPPTCTQTHIRVRTNTHTHAKTLFTGVSTGCATCEDYFKGKSGAPRLSMLQTIDKP